MNQSFVISQENPYGGVTLFFIDGVNISIDFPVL